MTAPPGKAKRWTEAEVKAAISTMSLYFAKPDRRYALELIITGLAIAGLYRLWERRLKEFLVGEVRHYESQHTKTTRN